MATKFITYGKGYIPDPPDPRDYSLDHPEIKPFFEKVGRINSIGLPCIDLRKWCSPIDNQLQLGSCTANAGVGLVEFFEIKHYGMCTEASRRFLYKVTRNLLHWVGDTGAYQRTTMKAMTLFGVVPEEYWPYTDKPEFDVEPPAFCYAFANQFQALKYYRLDPPRTTGKVLLNQIKLLLSLGLPSMFGMPTTESFPTQTTTGEIPFPVLGEADIGGHAMMIVGFDNTKKIRNPLPGGIETTGALLVRNSWGTEWGMQGYGWLPYKFVLDGITTDWWSLLKNEWLDLSVFN